MGLVPPTPASCIIRLYTYYADKTIHEIVEKYVNSQRRQGGHKLYFRVYKKRKIENTRKKKTERKKNQRVKRKRLTSAFLEAPNSFTNNNKLRTIKLDHKMTGTSRVASDVVLPTKAPFAGTSIISSSDSAVKTIYKYLETNLASAPV